MKLNDSVEKLPGVGPSTLTKLEKLGIFYISDLLYHVPSKFNDFRIITPINRLKIGESATIIATVVSIKNIFTRTGKFMQIGAIEDESGKLTVMWFNQTFITRTMKKGGKFSFSGTVNWYNRKPALMSPIYEPIGEGSADLIHTGRLVPIYPETRGLNSKWLRTRIWNLLKYNKEIGAEFLKNEDLKKHKLLEFDKALTGTHFPENLELFEDAKRRLSFNELLFSHLKNLLRKKSWKNTITSHKLKITDKILKDFTDNLSFKLTASQIKAVGEILKDLKGGVPMNRLLEGDVGSGKTVVAAIGAFAAFVNGYQTVVMAPTQILAEQHFQTLSTLFEKFNVRVSMITGSTKKEGYGRADIFVGTHSLIHKKVKFDNVAYVVIDEQHRFGVEQRAHLVKKSKKGKVAPHALTMTATPIPRTIALTLYGDLDLSTLTELPTGRQKITTWLVPPQKHGGALNWIEKKIKGDGDQAYIVCPLIEESESEKMAEVKAVKKTYDEVSMEMKGVKIGLLHGKMKAKEKTEVLDKFKAKKIDVLVTTPVIEVGIDVPNATIMMVEGSERFGMSQLHQLRGRVGRGDKKSYCLLFTSKGGKLVTERLSAMTKSHSGFELAEIDLKLRGPGEIFGLRQHGFAELKVANWQDAELIKETKLFAEEVVKKGENIYPKLWKIMNVDNIVAN